MRNPKTLPYTGPRYLNPVPAKAVWYVNRITKEAVWLLKVAPCPFCGKKHTHGGGGNPAAPDYGLRASHCDSMEFYNYYLVAESEAKNV